MPLASRQYLQRTSKASAFMPLSGRRTTLTAGIALIALAGVIVIAAPTQTRVRRAVDLAVLNKRVSEHFSAGKFDEAIPLAEKSLDLTDTQMGADHLDTAARMGWLAELYRNQGRYPEAEPLYKRALAKLRRTHCPAIALVSAITRST